MCESVFVFVRFDVSASGEDAPPEKVSFPKSIKGTPAAAGRLVALIYFVRLVRI